MRHLKYFVAVAERLHFGQAATALHMAQPPLSAAIRDLEGRLGVRLLDRTSRRVSLTPAGTVFLEHARRVLRDLQEAGEAARRAASGLSGEASLGFAVECREERWARILEALDRELPDVAVRWRTENSTALTRAVAAGQLDVAVAFCPTHEPELRYETLSAEPARVVLATDDPLASHNRLALHDLRGRPLVVPDAPPGGEGDGYVRLLQEACEREAVEPRFVRRAYVSWIDYPSVAVVPAPMAGALRNVAVRPLRPALEFPYEMVWRGKAAPLVDRVMSVVLEIGHQRGWMVPSAAADP